MHNNFETVDDKELDIEQSKKDAEHIRNKAKQKKNMQRKFAKRMRDAQKIKQAATAVASAIKKAVVALFSNPATYIVLGIVIFVVVIGLLIFTVIEGICSGEDTSALATTFLSYDADIQACEEYYTQREKSLQRWIDNIQSNYTADEYDFSDLATISHNPYVVAAYLNALKQETFTLEEAQNDIDRFFESQYQWYTTDEYVDREVNDYDRKGRYKGKKTITVHILHVHVVNNGEISTAYSLLPEKKTQTFTAQVNVKGHKPYLWDGYEIDKDVVAGMNRGSRKQYKCPVNLTSDDPKFAKLLEVGDAQTGTPYVWGGCEPGGFDCSGFVYYVYNTSGYASMPRMCAQDIYNNCRDLSYDEVKPGDLVFLTGTYATSKDVTHVAIYVGNGMVLNCGDPVKYCNINTSWWRNHFYAYGRYGG